MANEQTSQSQIGTVFLGFMKIIVKDLPGALQFYEQVLSLKLMNTIEGPGFTEMLMAFPGQESGPYIILYQHTDQRDVVIGNGWGPIGISVSDVDAIYAKALENGARSTREPFYYGETRIAFLLDPEGHKFELISQPKPLPSRISVAKP